jgi:hypothetical protein
MTCIGNKETLAADGYNIGTGRGSESLDEAKVVQARTCCAGFRALGGHDSSICSNNLPWCDDDSKLEKIY